MFIKKKADEKLKRKKSQYKFCLTNLNKPVFIGVDKITHINVICG